MKNTIVSVAVRSEPAEAGEYLDLALTVSNSSTFDRSDVVLKFRYPEHLASLSDDYLGDGGYDASGSTCEFREFIYWAIGTLPAGTSKTVTLPPMITADTVAGTVIALNPLVSDSSETWMTQNRCIAVQNEQNLELRLNTGMDSIQPADLLTYTLSYGIRATSSRVSDTVLALSLPDHVSFVSATGTGALSGDTVQWSLGTMDAGQVGEKQVTVRVDSEAPLGYLMEAQAVLKSASQSDVIIRADATTKIVEETPLLLSIQAAPNPAEAGEQLDTELTITNTSSFDRSDIVLRFRYPEHLGSLSDDYLSDGGNDASGSTCEFREFIYWAIETLPAGTSKTVTLPPTVSSSTIDGTLIDFDAVVYDATARSRAEHTVRIGQLASEPETHLLTVAVAGGGSVTSDPAGIDCPGDCTESYAEGTQIKLTAAPENGWTFKEWTGGCTGTQTNCVVTLSEDLQVTATFIEQESDPEYIVLTDETPETLASGSNTIVYGCHEANAVVLESGAVARLKNFPDSNTITILSNSGLFTVSRSGATVTFTGSDGTSLVMPATSTVQSIVFTDKTLELSIRSGAVMLGDQTISAESAAIE